LLAFLPALTVVVIVYEKPTLGHGKSYPFTFKNDDNAMFYTTLYKK
jgi:hypothetical protein